MSYAEVAHRIERVSGQRLVCEQTLHNWVPRKARAIERALSVEVAATQSLPFPSVAASVDLYDTDAEEVLVLLDAIGVKAQKPTRDKPGVPEAEKTVKCCAFSGTVRWGRRFRLCRVCQLGIRKLLLG
jgi:hypothetical protein